MSDNTRLLENKQVKKLSDELNALPIPIQMELLEPGLKYDWNTIYARLYLKNVVKNTYSGSLLLAVQLEGSKRFRFSQGFTLIERLK